MATVAWAIISTEELKKLQTKSKLKPCILKAFGSFPAGSGLMIALM
jgi:hypothetical protein